MALKDIKVNPSKERNPSSDIFYVDGKEVVIGKDWALQNEIDEARERTKARGCYKECRTCGACAVSRRDTSFPYRNDPQTGKLVNCKTCEPFRYHDCHNGWLRNTYGEAEPFTEDMIKLIEENDGKPLI